MYAKCGSMEDVLRVFNKMPIHDVVSWMTMLKCYAHFKWMCEKGVLEIDNVCHFCLFLVSL
jgi:pentatricopeptide repeat protein